VKGCVVKEMFVKYVHLSLIPCWKQSTYIFHFLFSTT
jgi:hypothetical protein